MDSDSAEMVSEVKTKVILHWNCRGLVKFPEAIRDYGNHIQEIYLKWNKLTTLPPWIIELFNVTNLYLYGNLIKELPSEFGQMRQLTVLDLSANKLERIPSCVGSLMTLKSLLVNDNSINQLPVEIKQLNNLELLSISGNKFIALPEWIGSLPKLKELNADSNQLVELPNRLTLSPEISIISVCSNRLRYLPLNGFVSSPCIKFDANIYLNYLSYPLLYQLISQMQDALIHDRRNTLGYGCFKIHCETNAPNPNIKLNIKINPLHDKGTNFIIELPRQLLKVHNIYENVTVSLWELALRKIYTERYTHTLTISTSPKNITVNYKPVTKSQNLDLATYPINHTFYNLLMNGPVSICVNSDCQQPVFTEAWVIAGISRYTESVTTVALCCCKRCASNFATHSNMTVTLDWHFINY